MIRAPLIIIPAAGASRLLFSPVSAETNIAPARAKFQVTV